MAGLASSPAAPPDAAGAFVPVRVGMLSRRAPQLHRHLARLDDADRRARLGRPVAAPAVADFCSRARIAEPLVIGGFVRGELIASAELFALPKDHLAVGRAGPIGDLMIATERPYRGRGVAMELIRALVRRAALCGIPLVRMDYDPDNVAMARLTARLGAVHSRFRGLVRAEILTGWLSDGLVPLPAERQPGYRTLW